MGYKGHEVLEKIEEQVKVLQQTLLEVAHAQQCGSEWYTRGEDGLYSQVSMWVRRGQTAIDEINKIVKGD